VITARALPFRLLQNQRAQILIELFLVCRHVAEDAAYSSTVFKAAFFNSWVK